MKKHRFTNITGDMYFEDRDGSGGEYRSKLERDECIYWLMEPGVKRVVIEPITIEFMLNGTTRKYTPDLRVDFIPPREIESFYVECKYDRAVDNEMEIFHKCIEAEFASRGSRWKRRTEKDTYCDEFSIRRFLLLARDEPADGEVEKEILQEVKKSGKIEVGKLLKRLTEDRRKQLEIVPQVWRLVAYHRLGISKAPTLGEHTTVWIA